MTSPDFARPHRIAFAIPGLLALLTSACGVADDGPAAAETAESSLTTTTYEAELALVSGPRILNAFPGFTGMGYADYQAASGEFVEWTVQAGADGTNQLTIRYANGATASRPLQILINGVTFTGALAFPPTGGWDRWSTVSVNAPLKAGANKIRALSTGSSGANLDNLAVTPLAFQVTVEAETALLSGPVVSSLHAGFTGSGYADYQAASGEFIEWTVVAPAFGSHTLTFRHANGGTTSRPLSVTANGVDPGGEADRRLRPARAAADGHVRQVHHLHLGHQGGRRHRRARSLGVSP